LGHANSDASANLVAGGAAALPAYVGSEVVTRGLIALRDTRTPLLTNSAVLAARAYVDILLHGFAELGRAQENPGRRGSEVGGMRTKSVSPLLRSRLHRAGW